VVNRSLLIFSHQMWFIIWVLLIVFCKIDYCPTRSYTLFKVLNQNLKFHQMDFWFEFLNIQMNEEKKTCYGFKWQNLNIYQILTIFFVVWCPFWFVGLWLHLIEGIFHGQLENKLSGVKVQSAFDVMDYCFTSTLGCYFKLVLGKMCCKSVAKLEA
jgi:hypothetical protein